MLVLTFQIGSNRLALDIRQVREVVPRVNLDQPANRPGWLSGLFVYRGQVVPVIDLHHLLDAGECPPHLSSRIVLVPLSALTGYCPTDKAAPEPLIGLLAAQVADIQEVHWTDQPLPTLNAPGQPGLGTPLVDEGGILHLLDLSRLVPEAVQRLALALPAREGT